MRVLALVAALLLASCDKQVPVSPVLVFAAGQDRGHIANVLEEVATGTGYALDIRWGDSGEILEMLGRKRLEPADIVITDSVADIWRAAERGALRPIQSRAFDAQQDLLSDPDRFWMAISVSFHAIFHGPGVRPVTVRLDDLAGRVCLSSARLGVNRSLISFLIEERGEKAAERLVRLWVRNLARPPFATQTRLLDAVRDGHCDYGLGGSAGEVEGVTPYLVDQYSIDIEAAGIGRHARNPDAAQAIVDWLLRNRPIDLRSKVPPHPGAVYVAGYRDEEARLLAERAGYR